jgi:hypothetical protein
MRLASHRLLRAFAAGRHRDGSDNASAAYWIAPINNDGLLVAFCGWVVNQDA